MKRWSILLLLLLLPLTMAPRTSFDVGDYSFAVSTPRETVRPGSSLPVTVTLTNIGTAPTALEAMVFTFTLDDLKESPLTVRAVSSGCMAAGMVVGCWIPPLDPADTTAVRMVVTPQQAGQLALRMTSRTGVSYGTVTWGVGR
jgi:hypothetical protein